ncbi:MAG: FISUMP domain-containing protein [Paludibacter sp.]
MKNKYLKLSIFFLLLSFGLKAQESITLSFNSTSILDSVKIDNLNNSTYKTLKGSYSFILQFGATNLIENIELFGKPLAYPNPFNQEVKFEFLSQYLSNVDFAVYDLSGKVVAQLNKNIDQGSHRFTFKPSKQGIYLVRISDKSSIYNAKIICTEANTSTPAIEYDGLLSTQICNQSKAKSTVVNTLTDLTAKSGDMLRFTGYSGIKINSIYDLVYSNKSYSFTFGDRYFNFKNYTIQSSKPCFVDVMFSVTDVNKKGIDYLSNTDFTVSEDNATISPSETFRFVRKLQQIPSKLKTVLLIDNSASVSSDIETIKTAAIKFVQSISDKQEIAIYEFSDSPVLLQNFTNNKTLLENAIKGISLGYSSTNLYGSIITSLSQWSDSYAVSGLLQGSLIVFTDGSDTQGSSTLTNVTTARGDKKIYVIGLGSEISPTALNQIANPGPYYPIQKATELDAVFATIQSDILQFSNSFYWLNYMSPKRTGTHTLKVSATNNTNVTATSYLTGSFSASGYQSVLSGLYVNKEDTRLYGLDTIRCFYSKAGYSFTYDVNGINQYSKDSLVLNPVTYWASKPPVYSWSNSKSNVSTLKLSSFSTSTLFPNSIKSDTAFISLKDDANGYTKNIVLLLYPEYAELSTTVPNNVSYTTVTLGGVVTNIGKGNITERGICWSTTSTPTIASNKLAVGSGNGIYQSIVTGLAKGTKYYVRAYATNAAGTAYGNEFSFSTLVNIPTLTTTTVKSITSTSANCGGSITSDEGATVTSRGVCWSVNQNPTITDNKTVDGTGVGTFSSTITGLIAETIYYLRAYAINSVGIAYGAQVSFSTKLPSLTTTSVSLITATTASCGGNVTDIGGATVTARGVCWSTSSNPTIELSSKTSNGTGSGSFISSLTGLIVNTTYYVRAYATNSIGTVYGNEISFSANLPVISTSESLLLTSATAKSGGNVTNAGSTAVTERGVCWSTNITPTISNSKTSDGSGLGVFNSSITGITNGATYYVRAYATNSIGTAYGGQVIISTNLPILTTNDVTSVTTSTASCGGNITVFDGEAPILVSGVCWSTTSKPTTSLTTKTSETSGFGVFSSSITGLNPNTTYYVRAYATNIIGTSYGNELLIKSFTGTVTDIDGNVYNTVTIGTQVWTVENLKTTKLNDGSIIPLSIDTWSSMTTPAYCWYDNSITNKNIYGALYNFYAVGTGKLCPTGWHVPSDAEWTKLITFLGGASTSINKLKEAGISHWLSPNLATNESGFTALPAGQRRNNGTFQWIGACGYCWSSTTGPLGMNLGNMVNFVVNNAWGCSVRCVKD